MNPGKNKIPLTLLSHYHFSYNSEFNTKKAFIPSLTSSALQAVFIKCIVLGLNKNILYWAEYCDLYCIWHCIITACVLCARTSYWFVFSLFNHRVWLGWVLRKLLAGSVYFCSFCSECNVFMVSVPREAYIIP